MMALRFRFCFCFVLTNLIGAVQAGPLELLSRPKTNPWSGTQACIAFFTAISEQGKVIQSSAGGFDAVFDRRNRGIVFLKEFKEEIQKQYPALRKIQADESMGWYKWWKWKKWQDDWRMILPKHKKYFHTLSFTIDKLIEDEQKPFAPEESTFTSVLLLEKKEIAEFQSLVSKFMTETENSSAILGLKARQKYLLSKFLSKALLLNVFLQMYLNNPLSEIMSLFGISLSEGYGLNWSNANDNAIGGESVKPLLEVMNNFVTPSMPSENSADWIYWKSARLPLNSAIQKDLRRNIFDPETVRRTDEWMSQSAIQTFKSLKAGTWKSELSTLSPLTRYVIFHLFISRKPREEPQAVIVSQIADSKDGSKKKRKRTEEEMEMDWSWLPGARPIDFP